jgi:hypothetical protein
LWEKKEGKTFSRIRAALTGQTGYFESAPCILLFKTKALSAAENLLPEAFMR